MAEQDLSPTSISSTLSNIIVQTRRQADIGTTSSASPPISTPSASLRDEPNVLSDTTKPGLPLEAHKIVRAMQSADKARKMLHPVPESPHCKGRRSARSSRISVTTYNVQVLAGTAIHTPEKYLEKYHKNVLYGLPESAAQMNPSTSRNESIHGFGLGLADCSDPAEEQLLAEAAQRRTFSPVTDFRKEALRSFPNVNEPAANTLLGEKTLAQSALRKSASDSRLGTINSSPPTASSAASSKHQSIATGAENRDEIDDLQTERIHLMPQSKVWLRQGLYVGQHRDLDLCLLESQDRAKKRPKKTKSNGVLPLPMLAGDRLLSKDPRQTFRDFKLPFDIYSPLPRTVKVAGWVKLHRNRYIGDCSALWKRGKRDAYQCYCDVADGCGEACHNRVMAYECDSTNCRLTAERCGNRPFAELKRRAKGNRYDYGIEVLETVDRGYGVRAMRTFEPHQVIVECTGEIITQHECERRMKQVYKKDECYYFMSFDSNMIIDATRGTIARFVNHSCEPNCEMFKWTVGGEPRMALFAGPRGIMTGEELTYDYNFDPFSQANIQECLCGTKYCRGILGPKAKKLVDERLMTSALIVGSKRKVRDLSGSDKAGFESNSDSAKKYKVPMGSSVITKAKNASTQFEAARKQKEKQKGKQPNVRAKWRLVEPTR